MRFTHALLLAALSGLSGVSHAALECKFTSNDSLLIMSPAAQPSIAFLPVGSVGSTPVQVSSTIIMETTPALKSTCSVGDDGENVYQMTNSALLVGYIDNKALYRTNIEGIYYTLAFYPDGNYITAWFPLNPNGWYMTANDHDNEGALDGKTWHARMDIYQTNGFTGVPENINFLTVDSGPLGEIILGNPEGTTTSDHPRPLVNISEISFNVPLNRPTCALRIPYSVNLGEWSPAEVESGATTAVPFNITGTCANTHKVQLVLRSNDTTSDKNYFTNIFTTDGAYTPAGGVGVGISEGTGVNWWPIPADSWQRVVAVDYENPVTMIDKTLYAKLVKTGSDPVTAGAFGTNVIFEFTYE